MAVGFMTGVVGGGSSCQRSVEVCASRREFLKVAGTPLVGLALIRLPEISDAKAAPVILDNGLEYYDVKVGKGPSPKGGDLVIMNYIGYLSDGTVFDNTESPGRKPLAFRFGQRQVIPGWEEGMEGMKPGGVRKLKVPPALAYGDRGVCVPDGQCLVPPNETLTYDLKLIRVAISPI